MTASYESRATSKNSSLSDANSIKGKKCITISFMGLIDLSDFVFFYNLLQIFGRAGVAVQTSFGRQRAAFPQSICII